MRIINSHLTIPRSAHQVNHCYVLDASQTLITNPWHLTYMSALPGKSGDGWGLRLGGGGGLRCTPDGLTRLGAPDQRKIHCWGGGGVDVCRKDNKDCLGEEGLGCI